MDVFSQVHFLITVPFPEDQFLFTMPFQKVQFLFTTPFPKGQLLFAMPFLKGPFLTTCASPPLSPRRFLHEAFPAQNAEADFGVISNFGHPLIAYTIIFQLAGELITPVAV